MRAIRRTVCLLLVLVCPGLSSFCALEQAPRATTRPSLVLWAWERPEDLRFIDPARVGVAFLARTIRLAGARVSIAPRVQSLDTPKGTWLVAVARIKSDQDRAPLLNDSQRHAVADALVKMAELPGLAGIQIDFDAVASERPFYAAVVKEVRERMPASRLLSITALAGWCWFDDWIRDLPVDEAVPMLFRMGPESAGILRRIQQGEEFPVTRCQECLGISTDEMIARVPRGKRIYVFHPRSWTPDALAAFSKEIDK